jgi:hypothetical protein
MQHFPSIFKWDIFSLFNQPYLYTECLIKQAVNGPVTANNKTAKYLSLNFFFEELNA